MWSCHLAGPGASRVCTLMASTMMISVCRGLRLSQSVNPVIDRSIGFVRAIAAVPVGATTGTAAANPRGAALQILPREPVPLRNIRWQCGPTDRGGADWLGRQATGV